MKLDELTHWDQRGRARMVDVGGKTVTYRRAVARGKVRMAPETLARLSGGSLAKGEPLSVARVAGILAAKKTDALIPLCHGLGLDAVEVDFAFDFPAASLLIEARVTCTGKTGVEMEALTAVAVAALTVYDMAKAIDRSMVVGEIRLVEKSGGRSGHFRREGESPALAQEVF